MTFMFALAITSLYVILFAESIKKHSRVHYTGALLLSLAQIALLLVDYTSFHPLLREIIRSFTSGIVGTSVFVIVMFMGTFDMKDPLARKLRMIRKELSIIACYLVLYHIVAYTVSMLPRFLTLPLHWQLVSITGILAMIIMIPLWITSYDKVRKKMKTGQWKKVQRWSYLFYFLIYAHMIVANIRPDNIMIDKIAVYTSIFFVYTYYRIKMYAAKRHKTQNKKKRKAA